MKDSAVFRQTKPTTARWLVAATMSLGLACGQAPEGAATTEQPEHLLNKTAAGTQARPADVVAECQGIMQSGALVRTVDQHRVVGALVGAHTRMGDPVGLGESLEQARSAGIPGGLLADEIRKSPQAVQLAMDDDRMGFRYAWEALLAVETLSDEELVKVGHWVLAHPEHRLSPQLAARAFARLAAAFARTDNRVALGKLMQRAHILGVAGAVDAAAHSALATRTAEAPHGGVVATAKSIVPAPEPLPGPAPEENVP